MAVTLTNGQTVTSASFLSGGHKTYFVPSLESTYSWAAQASASATAAAQSAQAAAASAAAAANAGNNDVTAHAADLTKHLTPAQNTLLDGITATFAEVNVLAGASANTQTPGKAVIRGANGEITTGSLFLGAGGIAATQPSRIPVETNLNGLLKWQSPSDFFKSMGAIGIDQLNRGRFLRETNGGTLQSGVIYGIYTGDAPKTMALPSFANAYNGMRIEVCDIAVSWGSNNFTITCDTQSYIGTQAGGESLICDISGIHITLTCCKDTGFAVWSIG